jgi:tetratricopeptide (TPR) repeat protein
MTGNHLLLYRLAELMLEHEQQLLPVDLLFDDEQIGDFAKSIQIDSPYQQMLFEGVLTESVRDEKLYVSFTVEGYFHYVLGEVIYNRTEGLGAEALKQIIEKNKLNGAMEGVEQCLIRDVHKDDLTRLMWLIDQGGEVLDLSVVPLASSFINFYSESKNKISKEEAVFKRVRFILKHLYNSPTVNDDLVLFKCIDYLKLKYSGVQLDAIQSSLDIIVQSTFTEKNILVLLKLFPWIRELNKKKYYVSFLEKLSSEKCLSDYIKWEINSSLSVYFKYISEYLKAKYYHRKVKKYELKSIGKLSTEYAESIYFDGLLKIESGLYKDARKIFRSELKIREKISRNINNDMLITRCIHSIALTYHYQGNYKKGIANYELALARRLIEGGKYCGSTLGTLANLGISIYEAGISLDIAEVYIQDAIRINKNLKGTYCDNSNYMFYLASIKLDKNELQEAEEILKNNLKNIESNLDFVGQSITMSSYQKLGEICYKKNEFLKAIEYFSFALYFSKKCNKNNLSFIQEMKFNKGLCFLNQGEKSKAKLLFMDCLRTDRNGLLLNLVGLCLSEINHRLALKYHIMALEQYKKEMPMYQVRGIEVLDSIENNSFHQLKNSVFFKKCK